MAIEFPRRLLREQNHDWNIVGNTAGAGQTSGASVDVRSDGGGLWMAQLNNIRFLDASDTRLWRAIRQLGNGGVAPIVVPRNDVAFAPWPAGVPDGAAIPFSVGELFDDGSGFYQPIIDVTCNGGAALRATSMDITLMNCAALQGGEAFSIQHPTFGWRLYEIATAVDNGGVMVYGPADGFTKLLLHFDGSVGSTSFVDSSPSPKTFTAAGNARIDTAQSRFGGASGLFDGVGDYISSPDHADFALGSNDFTVDCWFSVSAAGGSQLLLSGQMDSVAALSTTSFYIERKSSNDHIRFLCSQGAATNFTVESLAAYTNAVNTGWHHLAVVRSGSSLMMFIDGVIQQTTAITGAINNSSNTFTVGRGGEVAASEWNGWIDEFRLSVGIARWTSNFTPPVVAHSITIAPVTTITFNPPLREAVAAGTQLEFDRPRCLMKLANPGAMDLNVTTWPFSLASVKFIESKYAA